MNIPIKFNLFHKTKSRKRIQLIHPVHGDVEAHITIDHATFLRNEVQNAVNYINIDGYMDILETRAIVCASTVVDWDYVFFDNTCNYDNALELLSDPSNDWILSLVHEGITELDDNYTKGLESCVDNIKKFWDTNKSVAGATKTAHYKRLEENYDKLPPNFKAEFDLMKAKNDHILNAKPFVPTLALMDTYISFFAIRNTIAQERLITHADIKSYCDVTHKPLNIIEINGILTLDREFTQARFTATNTK